MTRSSVLSIRNPAWCLHVIAFVMFGIVAHSVPAEEPENIPLNSAITRVQPMTGIALWTDHEKVATDSISLEYRYCGYNEIVQPNGEYDFAKLDGILDEIAERGHQAILRFYFVYVGRPTTVPDSIRLQPGYQETVGTSEKKKTHFCDWSNRALQEFTLEFYSRLADRYDADPRIAFLQTGFGLWAEYHIYDGPRKMGKTFPSKEFQSKFLNHLDGAFDKLPWSISVDSADYDYSPLEDNEKLLAIKFGLFDDSFLCKQHPGENAQNWKTLGLDRWKHSPGGGEFSYYNKRDQKMALAAKGPNGISFQESAKQFHLSYILGNDQPQYRKLDQIASASMNTGYRFKVTSAKIEGNILRLNVTNVGVAPIYRDAYLAAGNKRSQKSLIGLLPGESLECVVSEIEDRDLAEISIQSDAILKSQEIQFEANLK